jgi:hypothetical protein
VQLPFTPDQFLSVFERYNRAIEPAPFFAYVAGAVALVFACRGGRRAGRLVLGTLAAFWAVSGAGYHLAFFRAINPVASAFGALFLAEAALLLRAALRREAPAFRLHASARHAAALALAVYALAAYPRIAAAVGHEYPRAPVFGVAPCPTTIFTIAVLLLAEPRPSALLLAIPLAWSLVGSSAAVQLGMTEDYGLALAGLVAVALWAIDLWRRGRAGREHEAHAMRRAS